MVRRVIAGLLLSLATLAGAGCASGTDGRATDPTLTAVRDTFFRPDTLEPKEFVRQGARRTGQFPTFGEMPRGATAQISDADRARIEAEIVAAQAAQQSDPASAAEYEERLRYLRELARTHGPEVRAEIEN